MTAFDDRNAEVLEAAKTHKWRTRKNEDGEVVVRLVGRPLKGWPSSDPHAGAWGAKAWYVYLPSKSPGRKAEPLCREFPDLTNRSGDCEVLLLGPTDTIHHLLDSGPKWCRARKKVSKTDDQKLAAATRLHPHRFKPGEIPRR